MKVFICIDDTDNLESIGTGHLAARLIEDIESNAWGKCLFITRHQLFVHPDVPYTSHNSAMCFEADVKESRLDDLIHHAARFLQQHSAIGSDPGLCVAAARYLSDPLPVISFGQKAKRQVLDKNEAYNLAGELGIHLSEHGGTGGGVIGALAGVGLRMGGNDGRVRGKLQVAATDNSASAADIRRQTGITEVRTMKGDLLEDRERIILGEWIKAVYQDGNRVLLVKPLDTLTKKTASWRICTKEELRSY